MQATRCTSSLPRPAFVAASVAAILTFGATAHANEDQSYEALRQWVEVAPALDDITPGQHLTAADRDVLETVIPRSAWKYYIFDDLDMEIAPTAHYPAPEEWGQNMSSGYDLDEHGVLRNFEGGGFPFAEIEADDPMAGQKVIWNMLWRPGENDYTVAAGGNKGHLTA